MTNKASELVLQESPADPISLIIDSALQAALTRYRTAHQKWWTCPRDQVEKSAKLRKVVDEAADAVAQALSAQMDSSLDESTIAG